MATRTRVLPALCPACGAELRVQERPDGGNGRFLAGCFNHDCASGTGWGRTAATAIGRWWAWNESRVSAANWGRSPRW